MINILDKSIYNLIAAGEVVERPASVVKELVENSIDSGATNVTIEIEEGGIKKIRVTDNGCGIQPDDLPKAFLPHATSKITTKDDLSAIGTLGFRGEALSSIAAISRINIVSKTKENINGFSLDITGGEISDIFEKGNPNGTVVEVGEIFFNVPARAKFLRSARSEAGEISNLISRLILSSPDISFKYINNGQVVYNSDGNGIESALIAVYGKSVMDKILKIHTTMSDIIVSGYIGIPSFSKPNRTYQTLIINKRYVINSTVSKAVFDAYGDFLMKNQYPFFVLKLDLPFESIDVNVHPNKLDVRFSESDTVYRAVRRGVESVLKNGNLMTEITKPEKTTHSSNELLKGTRLTDAACTLNEPDADMEKIYEIVQEKRAEITSEELLKNSSFINRQSAVKNGEPFTMSEGAMFEDIIRKMRNELAETKHSPQIELSLQETHSANKVEQHEISLPKIIKKIGELFKTYILIEYDSDLYIVDQHAAHERILYDKFINEADENNIYIQDLLIPYVFEVNNAEYEMIMRVIKNINELGFIMEPLSMRSFKISAVPAVCSGLNLKMFVDSLLGEAVVFSKASDVLKEKIAQCACKAAVKSGDVLKDSEINLLINAFNNSDTALLCPHGRPVIIKIKRNEIEKWFKRKL